MACYTVCLSLVPGITPLTRKVTVNNESKEPPEVTPQTREVEVNTESKESAQDLVKVAGESLENIFVIHT